MAGRCNICLFVFLYLFVCFTFCCWQVHPLNFMFILFNLFFSSGGRWLRICFKWNMWQERGRRSPPSYGRWTIFVQNLKIFVQNFNLILVGILKLIFWHVKNLFGNLNNVWRKFVKKYLFCQDERLKLPDKLVSFMESREEILVRQMPVKEAKEEEVGQDVTMYRCRDVQMYFMAKGGQLGLQCWPV